jgi:predicted SnoaL-like aldol condensation-catalyzing enzyme
MSIAWLSLREIWWCSTLFPGRAIVDIFRLQNGKIVEHWDVTQDISAQGANSDGMF